MIIGTSFYQGSDVVRIAKSLLGKLLLTHINGIKTGGKIVETEAYSWRERGCHAFGGRMTARNKVMFDEGGKAYVYLCYGVHNLFNVVTNKKGVADAVLIRAIEPVIGLEKMKERRGELKDTIQLTSGPGKLTKALGIDRSMNGNQLNNDEVWIEDNGTKLSYRQIEISKRIGISYAGVDADLPWRFSIKDNRWISK